jgi:pimeloyl-ACP methyl ester carboxylesterase
MSDNRLLALVVSLVLMASGCALLGVSEQRETVEEFARIRGSVRLIEQSESPIVVVLLRKTGADPSEPVMVDDHFGLERPGNFAFVVSPGVFRLAAFEDRNANLSYDPGEPALHGQAFFEMGPGEIRDDIELVVPADQSLDVHLDLRSLEARIPRDQHHFSLGRFTVRGEVVDLDDERFGPKSGSMGMWRFADFVFELGPGVYFLEEYDPKKIPILFVHGISGYPQEFSTLIEKLDRDHFQPWFYFYPSGMHLDGIASHAAETVAELQILHGFTEMAVVAHSMGGLVSRSFILKHWQQTKRADIGVFVAISSPWGGSESAANVQEAPEGLVVYSWLDMSPDSDFLKGLFYAPPDYQRVRGLPPHTDFHMLFGYKRPEHSFGPSGDGVLTVKSETRLEAIEAARSILPLDYTHVGILHSGEAVSRLNTILGNAF